jgi:enamine deaminase RidA (YjgF/YER057c/UK114 family)
MQSGTLGRVHYRRHERLLFAAVCLAETQFCTAGAAPAAALQAATATAYNELFGALEQLGCPHPLRMWNYLPQINDASDGTERYWHFHDARRDAFVDARRATHGNVPAASVLGTAPGGALVIYCLAAAQPPIALENPRQCSAWRYPPQYGPRRPIFARACIEADGTLFISGTASIVGHESTHAGDVAAQTRETVSNIQALLQAANERAGRARYAAERLRYKVYVREPADQPLIEQTLREQIGPAPPVLFLRADICRRELLVEIEAVGT